jgi:transcription elongation GreA/GreB family factor
VPVRPHDLIANCKAPNARKYEPVLLNQARNKLEDARNLMDTNDESHYDQARRLLEQASVDAKLAGARSETAKARQAVEEINQNIKKLQDQLSNTQ